MTTIGSLQYVGTNFWHLQAEFYYAMGLVDIKTQMAFVKLSSGKFLVIDTVKISEPTKADIDKLTENGSLIEAVIATHPYHTIYFEAYQKLYPNAKYYGTPRHVREIKSVKWDGDITENLSRWENEGVEMRIPDGCNFAHSIKDNHFAGIFVFHKPSRTVFIDDTIMRFHQINFIMGMAGQKAKRYSFHPTLHVALNTPEAPIKFKNWLQKILDDWDFDNLAIAHGSVVIGGAKEGVQALLKRKTSYLEELAMKKIYHSSKNRLSNSLNPPPTYYPFTDYIDVVRQITGV